MMFLSLSKLKISKKVNKDLKALQNLLLYQNKKQQKQLLLLYKHLRVSLELMMVSLIRIISLSNPGTMSPCNRMINKLEIIFRKLKRVKPIATWVLTAQLMKLLKIFNNLIQNWLLIVWLSELHRRLLLRLSSQPTWMLTLFKRMVFISSNLQINWLQPKSNLLKASWMQSHSHLRFLLHN